MMDVSDPGDKSVKRIRLTGERFSGGKLPIDSLIELERYQSVVRTLAEFEWKRDHPGQDLPADFRSSVSLSIDRIVEGSADVFLVHEQVAVYQQYQDDAQAVADATLLAAYSGAELPELPVTDAATVMEVRETLAAIGSTLSNGQSIEYYVEPNQPPVVITVESRPEAEAALRLTDFLLPAEPTSPTSLTEKHEESLVGRVTAIDADTTKFELVTPAGKVHGWYRENTELLEDLRAVLNTAEEGPLTRISGELQTRNGAPWRYWTTSRVERIEFADTTWGRRLADLAQLPADWAGPGSAQVSFVSLDAANHLLSMVEDAGGELPGIFATAEGGVLMEWSDSGWLRSIEVLDDGTFELFALTRGEAEGSYRETSDASDASRFALGESA